MKTKRIVTTIALLLASFMVRAQDSHTEVIPIKELGTPYFTVANLFQQRDGNLVTNVYIGQMPDGQIVGTLLLKLSPTTLQFTDSLFVDDTDPPFYLYEKDPRGEGNIRASIEPDGNGNSQLRISRFTDDDLHVIPIEDVVVPLCEGEVIDALYSYLMDCQGNLILKYYKVNETGDEVCHIVRFSPEGTFLCEAELPISQNYIRTMEVFNEAPIEYYQWRKGGGGHLNLFVIDSVFQVTNTLVVNKMLFEDTPNHIQEYFDFGSDNWNSTFVVHDGGDVLVASRYIREELGVYPEYGIAVARYDLRTMQRKALVQFNDYPGFDARADCYGFQKMPDGTVYLLYREDGMPVKYWMTVVKMDSDLNVIWKRYCETPGELISIVPFSTYVSVMLEDEEGNETGMVISGSSFDDESDGIFYCILTHDGITAVSENGIEVRPYLFYPNPAQDRLHFQFSPDVKPTQVELYDLQGRLVRTQGDAFDSLDLGMLPAGTYTLRITMEDGQTFSDKVVKE